MTMKLTDEMRQALSSHRGQPVAVEDDRTAQVYVLVDQQLHERAMQALREQEDLAAIQSGIDDMEAGRLIPLAEADAEIRKQLGFAPRPS